MYLCLGFNDTELTSSGSGWFAWGERKNHQLDRDRGGSHGENGKPPVGSGSRWFVWGVWGSHHLDRDCCVSLGKNGETTTEEETVDICIDGR